MEALRMTRKKTHKEKKSMPSAAKKLRVVHNNEPEPAPEQVAAARAEELRLLEALLFASRDPIDEATLRRHLPDGVDLKDALARLKAEYASRGVTLVKIGKKWTFRTADDLSWLLTKQTIETRKLSRAAVETLAIIAYHQPVTRAEIEEIRGVQTAGGTLDVLLKTGWIRPRGRRKAPGRPITYGTTDAFLEHYGLASVGDLPGAAEMRAAGLLSLDLPADFAIPDPNALGPDEDPLDEGDAPQFHTDFLGEETA
jgi:segregation and condensation protein B